MQHSLLQLFKDYPQFAVIISLVAGILIAVIGVLPSVFLTAANILFFGFWNGTFISFLGESMGAAIAFLLYRKGFKKRVGKGLQNYPKLKKLTEANNKEAFTLVFSLRLIPFVPSGLVTLAAAVGKAPFFLFLVASSLGKLPALFMEAYAVYEVTKFGWQGKLILVMVGLGLVYGVFKKINKR
ncbi:MAG: TVP38/TMEM64 family protein [Ferruginibacter sp.]|nr:TVP38/TMEM64 family protein [Ferruginibacter sp.]